MDDDPSKSRLEDHLNKVIRSGVQALPVIGGSLAEFLTYVIGDPAQERRDEFMRDIYNRIVDLQSQYEALQLDKLRENEAFQATFIEAAQVAMRTVQEEKKEMLRNAINNSAIGTIDENVRQMFMQFIDRLTPLHVAIAKTLDNPKANPAVADAIKNTIRGGLDLVINAAIPELQNQEPLTRMMFADLNSMGLLNSSYGGMMSANGLIERRTTELGQSFLKFISKPGQ
jgi:hypothetical protein